jgi:lysine biosynthesis protein LysW
LSLNRVVCPQCQGKLDLDSRLEVGEEVTCARCGADWKVVRKAPLVLDWLEKELESASAKRWVMQDVRAEKVPAHRFSPLD